MSMCSLLTRPTLELTELKIETNIFHAWLFEYGVYNPEVIIDNN